MVKLVATQVLGTCGEIRGGSSPSTRTKYRKTGFESLHPHQDKQYRLLNQCWAGDLVRRRAL